jgi:metal-responsive CopG/Arc/MetJ family transcriptional regulator
MKTTIHLPDDLSTAVDTLATRLGMSRTDVYATAIAEYVAKHTPSEITTRLDEVYATESSGLDLAFRDAQSRTFERERW